MLMIIKMKKNNGFTLIELLVVMAVIGILLTISIGSFQSSQLKARDTSRKSSLEQIGRALEAYNNDKGQYPIQSADQKMDGCGDFGSGSTTCEWGAEWSDENGTIYMIELPADPTTGLYYYYLSDSGTSYQLYARLENDQDGSIPTSGGAPGNYSLSCGNLLCNYGVSSSNETIENDRTISPD